jgi:hypothetical protein
MTKGIRDGGVTHGAGSTDLLDWRALQWLLSLALLDVLPILVFVYPEWLGASRRSDGIGVGAVLATALPMVALWASTRLPPRVKDRLVFWRGPRGFPSHGAFTRYAPRDPRIDLEALRRNVGPLPRDAAMQHALWHSLYEQSASIGAVAGARWGYRLLRDMVAMSAVLAVLVPIALYLNGASKAACASSAVLFAAQYVFAAFVARNRAALLVTSAMVPHAALERPAGDSSS